MIHFFLMIFTLLRYLRSFLFRPLVSFCWKTTVVTLSPVKTYLKIEHHTARWPFLSTVNWIMATYRNFVIKVLWLQYLLIRTVTSMYVVVCDHGNVVPIRFIPDLWLIKYWKKISVIGIFLKLTIIISTGH